jgi:4-amino-4-deoxy-L-arabinose transferase-like glycosyltransferase
VVGDVVGGLVDEAPAAVGIEPSVAVRPGRTSRWEFWRSPPDQPRWARPALLLVAALAFLSYSWGSASARLETFYGAAVRSMSQNWHDFFFGAFDPWGTVSVDKLPGAFWLQALSVRFFGFHIWAMVLPQAIEGTLTVLVLYRAVRRVGGAGAGLVAAAALATTPVTILLNRGNISDSLLILLLVLAADATTSAFMTGRLQSLVLAGVWAGLAFQAKMLQAWVVLPALFLAYILAAPVASLERRVGHVALSLLAVLTVSLSWMCVVSLVPAQDRPYVDGSCDNSVFSQVFLYNGADRLSGDLLDQPGCSAPPVGRATSTSGGAPTHALARGPGRFLDNGLGREAAWLFVPSLAALVGILVARRRRPRTDHWRAAALLWGVWLFLTWSFFSSSHFLNGYYLAALAPPMAALCGLGFALAWNLREQSAVVPVLTMSTVAVGVAYAVYLVPDAAGVRPWVIVTSALATLGALGFLASSLRRGRRPWERGAGLGLALVALLLGGSWASATAVGAELGPFDSPYQPAAITSAQQLGWQRDVAGWPAAAARAAHFASSVSALTGESSAQASGQVLATGHEFLAVGGFSGQVPATPLRAFVDDVRAHRVSYVLVGTDPLTRNPDMRWVLAHCQAETGARATVHADSGESRIYLCTPVQAGGSPALTRRGSGGSR